jgi:hypothetical protein
LRQPENASYLTQKSETGRPGSVSPDHTARIWEKSLIDEIL